MKQLMMTLVRIPIVLCIWALVYPRMLWAMVMQSFGKNHLGPGARGGDAEGGEDRSGRGLDVVCVSHVDWEHAWQRNQHVMSHLARQGKVIYCVPVKDFSLRLYRKRVLRTFCRDKTGVWVYYALVLPGTRFSPAVERLNARLIGSFIQRHARKIGMAKPVLWYYFPEQVALTETLDKSCCVYDIQDNYTHFEWASPELAQREKALVDAADQVFTGTHSLYEKFKSAAGAIEFIPCGVDFDFFHAARGNSPPPVPEVYRDMKGPVLGYFGLVDDRIDLDLVDELARRRPEWQIVMIGPGWEHATEGRRFPENVHFVGHVAYEDLAAHAQIFDVCIMPFVLNELTRAINPTKTLEYFALERPVVSVPIPDMVKFYPDQIGFAEGADAWEKAVEKALDPDPARLTQALEIARGRSWESITKRFVDTIKERLS